MLVTRSPRWRSRHIKGSLLLVLFSENHQFGGLQYGLVQVAECFDCCELLLACATLVGLECLNSSSMFVKLASHRRLDTNATVPNHSLHCVQTSSRH